MKSHKVQKPSFLEKSNNALNVSGLTLLLKAAILGIVAALIISTAVNIFQAFKNDCDNIQEKINLLNGENDKLDITRIRLQEAQEELNHSINALAQQNEKLSESLDELQTINEEFDDNLNTLISVENDLRVIVNRYETTFDEFDQNVNELIFNLSAATNELESLTDETNNVSQKIQLVSRNISIETSKTSTVTSAYSESTTIHQALELRNIFYDSLILSEVLFDTILGFTQSEYDQFFRSIFQVFLTDKDTGNETSEELQRIYPFNNFTYDSAKSMLDVLLAFRDNSTSS